VKRHATVSQCTQHVPCVVTLTRTAFSSCWLPASTLIAVVSTFDSMLSVQVHTLTLINTLVISNLIMPILTGNCNEFRIYSLLKRKLSDTRVAVNVKKRKKKIRIKIKSDKHTI